VMDGSGLRCYGNSHNPLSIMIWELENNPKVRISLLMAKMNGYEIQFYISGIYEKIHVAEAMLHINNRIRVYILSTLPRKMNIQYSKPINRLHHNHISLYCTYASYRMPTSITK
jgi:hypothetical protein